MIELEEHLFRWDGVEWEEVTEKNKNRIIELIINSYNPKLSLTVKIDNVDAKTIKINDKKSTVLLILEADKSKLNVKITEKTDELIVKKDIDKKDSKEFIVYLTNTARGPDDRSVGSTGIALTMTYLFSFSGVTIYCLVQLCSYQAFPDEHANYVIVVSHEGSVRAQAFTDGNANPSNLPLLTVTFFRWTSTFSNKERLLFIVAVAGTLGSTVLALRSFYRYIGNRELVLNWLDKYLFLPVLGSLLGLISIYYNPQRALSPGNGSTNKSVCLCSYFCPSRYVLSTGCAQNSRYN